ncbi:MAG TPA: amidohydrolase family protein [Nocardioides sp.]|jgi:cytosine/adenosine deaminase-related metal-dependent hydrolase|nr:amidohydrolase family protein [Nocardioides sp.]
MSTTLHRAGCIVAFQDGEHRILRDGCLVVEDDRVIHVGATYDGPVGRVVDAPDRIITPGFVNTHAHLDESPIDKSVQEDVGNRQFWLTGLIEILPTEMAGLDEEGARACVDYSLIELARTGTTTVVQMGGIEEYSADAIEASGLRGYVAPMYRSGRWFTPDGRRVEYDWSPDDGRAGLEHAVDFVERLRGRGGGRVQGLLAPAQVDTCSEALLRDSKAAADALDVPISLHASQGVWEFQEMTRRHGRTPVEWLSDLGFLGPRTLLGHAVFLSGNSWVNFAGDDLGLLAASGTSVSYNAWCFIRRGLVMESFPEYVAAGVNMCLGTDTAPQSMIESLRWTAIAGKVAARRTDVSTARDVFDAATVNAAALLGRPDLGRIAPGAKADLLFWRADGFTMTPVRDPIRNLVYYAQPDDLADVMVDGRLVVEDGVVLGVDVAAATRGVQRAGERVWERWPQGDWAGRTLEQVAPQTYADFTG